MRTDIAAIDARAFGAAAGVVAAALVIICSLAIAIAPDATTAFAGYIIHADLSTLGRTLTWGNFIGGLLFWSFGSALVFGTAGRLYNRFSSNAVTERPADLRTSHG